MIFPLYLLLFPMAFFPPAILSHGDIDSDGISDELEQSLLKNFVPKFMISAEECDGFPSEFRPGEKAPQLLERNGTIYGQVFPIKRPDKPGYFIEIHYYHLWSTDCGINGHPLDAEHVSVLLSSDEDFNSADSWKAEYWYAAAHEDTVCDSSHGTGSSFLDSDRNGPEVWVSNGKHASYMDRELCKGGCGGDDCNEMQPLKISKLINLGEPGAPMNGASWVEWPGWPLADKMRTDFPEDVLVKLSAADQPGIIALNNSQSPVKGTILVSNATAGALGSTNRKTGEALSNAGGAVGKSIEKSKTDTGNSLMRAFSAIRNALGGGSKEKTDGADP